MKSTSNESVSNQPLGGEQQLLAELKVPAGSNARAIHLWLIEALNPFRLEADFLNRILNSAQDAVTRLMSSEDSAAKYNHIHIRVFCPRVPESTGKTWGFFRIEKFEGMAENKNPPDHSIEFHLYLEGS